MKETKKKKVLELLETYPVRSDTAIAKEVGCVPSYVYNLRNKSELRARQEKQIVSLLDAMPAWSPTDIARAVRCSYRFVKEVRDKWKQERETSVSVASLENSVRQEYKTSVLAEAVGVSAEVQTSYEEHNDIPPQPLATRGNLLDVAKTYITKDRQADHGDAEDNFSRIAQYWSVHLGTPVKAHDVAVMMALLKVARIKQNPHHIDNWVDGAGYFACGGEIANLQ